MRTAFILAALTSVALAAPNQIPFGSTLEPAIERLSAAWGGSIHKSLDQWAEKGVRKYQEVTSQGITRAFPLLIALLLTDGETAASGGGGQGGKYASQTQC